MKPNLYLSLLLFLLLGSCGNTSQESECSSDECLKQQAYDSVIAIHDKVMPKLAHISALKGQIEEKMNTLNDSLAKADLHQLMVNLDESDEAMWVWMRQFNSDLDKVPLDEALEYLKEEKIKINQVAESINKAIDEAEKGIKTTK